MSCSLVFVLLRHHPQPQATPSPLRMLSCTTAHQTVFHTWTELATDLAFSAAAHFLTSTLNPTCLPSDC